MLAVGMDRYQVSLGLFFLRMGAGLLLITGRSWIWASMLKPNEPLFSDPFGVGGEFNWFLSLFSEALCTVLVMFGVFTRFTAVPPMVVMLVTAAALPPGTAWSMREMYLLYALPFFVLTFTGPGDYSIDGHFAQWSGPRHG